MLKTSRDCEKSLKWRIFLYLITDSVLRNCSEKAPEDLVTFFWPTVMYIAIFKTLISMCYIENVSEHKKIVQEAVNWKKAFK